MKADLAGATFGLMSVLWRSSRAGIKDPWDCQCACGTKMTVPRSELEGGKVQSCGCAMTPQKAKPRRIRSHGLSHLPTYRIWAAMKRRCYAPNSTSYASYGGRGIRVCQRWMTFDGFYEDMGDRPPGKSIDRIDPNGHYEPGNCRWATPSEQAKTRKPAGVSYPPTTPMPLIDAATDKAFKAADIEGVRRSEVRSRPSRRMSRWIYYSES